MGESERYILIQKKNRPFSYCTLELQRACLAQPSQPGSRFLHSCIAQCEHVTRCSYVVDVKSIREFERRGNVKIKPTVTLGRPECARRSEGVVVPERLRNARGEGKREWLRASKGGRSLRTRKGYDGGDVATLRKSADTRYNEARAISGMRRTRD